MRYIDDISFIWTHGEDCLQEFISYLNSSHRTIRFTSEYSRIALNFLDVSIKVGVGGALGTDLFCKPTSTHQYLHSKSCHPRHTKKPFLLLRPSEYVKYAQIIAVFIAGWESWYEESFVLQQIGRVRMLDREALIRYSDKQQGWRQGRARGL